MIDNFITYDDPNGPTESDGYLNKLRDEMFHFGAAPPQNYGYPSHHHYPPQMNQIVHGDPTYEVFSHNSAYSTNPSTKESPEHTPSVEDHLNDDEKNSRVPPIVRKGIRKYYEPILDNGMVYNYEDDPNEYRKARKRIQNRESATRVRNRKKNHVEILEDEITDLKKSYNELQRENNMLLSENQGLRQKLSFFEKAVAKNNQVHQMNMNQGMPNQFPEVMPPHNDHILDFMDNTDNMGLNRAPQDFEHAQVNNMHPGMYRASNNSSKFKKHMALLGVFTLLLCVYGILPRTGVQLFALPKFTFTSNNVNNVPTPNNSHENAFGKANTNTVTVNPTEKPADQSRENDFGAERDVNNSNEADKQQENNRNFPEENKPENKDLDRQDEKPEAPPAPANQNQNSKPGPGPNPNANKNKGPFRPPNKSKKYSKGPERFGPNRRRMPPPNRGHHHPWQPRNQENNANTISILSMIEILVVACYSLYFIYVGFSAYKLHAAKRRRGGAMPVPL